MRSAAVASATLSVFATAVPPAARISSTTRCAGPTSWPSPVIDAPTSLTITLAPSRATASAMSRPMPPPAPVTITTLSSTILLISLSCRPLKEGRLFVQETGHRRLVRGAAEAQGLRVGFDVEHGVQVGRACGERALDEAHCQRRGVDEARRERLRAPQQLVLRHDFEHDAERLGFVCRHFASRQHQLLRTLYADDARQRVQR